jgi:hypothetical protein
MDANRQKLIERARELNRANLSVTEIQERIREVCSEFLIEAEVDVDALLRHEDWSVRSTALDIVWWGLGATDGISARTSSSGSCNIISMDCGSRVV